MTYPRVMSTEMYPGRAGQPECSVRLGSSVGVRSVHDADDRHAVLFVVDPIDHAVRAAAGAVPVVEWRTQLFPDSVGAVEQWADDEFVSRERDWLG